MLLIALFYKGFEYLVDGHEWIFCAWDSWCELIFVSEYVLCLLLIDLFYRGIGDYFAKGPNWLFYKGL